MKFGKVLTAMVTPLDNSGNIDFNQTTKLIEYLLENGSEGLVIAGTTGESPTLTVEEKVALFKHVVEKVNKRVPVIAGAGSNNTASAVALTKEAEAVGVDAIMLVTPYYNKPNQQGLYEHFATIAKETNLPVMMYNIPGRSVIKMNADTIIRLSEIENIVSVKEASGDLNLTSTVIEGTPDNFSVYCGEDAITLPMLAIGADGVVSVASHIIGNEMKNMVNAYQSGDVKNAASLHRKLLPIMNGLFAAPSPTPVKAALKMKGMDVGGVRLPLVPLTDQEESTLEKLIQ
ncbi:4-hydroxy-tetrahydrodipicolinate synthase [Virgibacillus litoralis]|uniref:4-hydroxy-tetrahydrodipicolinate synthase n=1 Tax=Virgibacillus litoralis TaxID=578221 RepID=A0ABS4HE33_9BACI|nr:4-hydroxy-tetrahydrodipicolinate synthase [Virgibacillus litoralis]MBP1949180.1 4-hydroxy-tetrahydrodipicolinate synthase [Virgibacillus litoralis]